MELKKMMDIRDREKNFFLGLNKNGGKMWLVAPSWCGWHWELGYIKTYQQNWSPSKARDILCSTHFNYVFPSSDIFINEFNDNGEYSLPTIAEMIERIGPIDWDK